MTNNLYTIKDLVFRYNGAKRNSSPVVLNIPELFIERNKVTVIRGHNGSGKTTLLKLLSGLLTPESGEVESESPHTVLVQQEPYLFHGSVYHNLTSPLRFTRTKLENEAQKVRETLQLVNLEGFEKRKARELSGGEKKRIAIARALMTEPDVLFLDEPDANVDAETSHTLEVLIRSLRDRNISVILCSHHKGFAYRCLDRIVDLYQGSPVDHDENIFKGEYEHREGVYSLFRIGDHSIHCPSRTGSYSTIVIPSESISLTKGTAPECQENCFKGKVASIQPFKDDRSTLDIESPIPFKVRTTNAELSIEKISEGDDVTILFNPSSVKLY